MKVKSIFSSLTFWGAILSLWLAVSPTLKEAAVKGRFEVADWFEMGNNAIATLLILIGRYNAQAVVFTPKVLPGRNKDEAENLVNPES